MAHAHHDVYTEHDIDVVETGGGRDVAPVAGMLAIVAALLIVALIAFAVLWTRPWGGSSSNSTPNNPGISDNSGGGSGSGGGTGGGSQGGGGSSGGSQDGGGSQSGGGAQPSQ